MKQNNSTELSGYSFNPPAPACQGHQGCGIRFNCRLTINNHCYSAIWLCFSRGLKSVVDHHPQIQNSGSVTLQKLPPFSGLFSRPKKTEKRLPKPQQNDRNRFRNPLNMISMKSRILQYLPYGNQDLKVPNVESSIQKPIKI